MSLNSDLKQQYMEAKVDMANGQTDAFAKYRAAENKILAELVFFEGCSYTSYKDKVKVDTIGVGNTKRADGTAVRPHDVIKNNQELLSYVQAHLEREVYPAINRCIKRDLSENELAALVSLIYNCGSRVLYDKKTGKLTALAKALNENNQSAVEREWMRYNRTAKGWDKGLAVRRTMELAMMSGKLDPEDLRICTYDEIDLGQVYRNGKPIKTDKAYQYMKDVCQSAPSQKKMSRFAYFNYGKWVKNFVSGLVVENTEEKLSPADNVIIAYNER